MYRRKAARRIPNSTQAPSNTAPIAVWKAIAAHFDDQLDLTHLEQVSPNFQHFVQTSIHEICEIAGATPVPPIVLEYCRVQNKILNYKAIAAHDTFNPVIGSTEDLEYNLLKSSDNFTTGEVFIGNETVRVMELKEDWKAKVLSEAELPWFAKGGDQFHYEMRIKPGMPEKIPCRLIVSMDGLMSPEPPGYNPTSLWKFSAHERYEGWRPAVTDTQEFGPFADPQRHPQMMRYKQTGTVERENYSSKKKFTIDLYFHRDPPTSTDRSYSGLIQCDVRFELDLEAIQKVIDAASKE